MHAIGFAGLGQMGAPMAMRLFADDTGLHVFDPRDEAQAPFTARGATGHASAASLAEACDIVFASLPGEAASLAVAEAAAAGRARLLVEMSTIGAPAAHRIAESLAARGTGFLDAPISGGPEVARAGRLAMMVAGAPDAVARARPFLERIGERVFVLGEKPGLAQTMKLVNNLIVAANMATAFEALVMGAKAGLDPDQMVEILNASSGRSTVSAHVVPLILSGKFDFGASIAVLDKDVALGLAEARALDVPMWTLEQAARLWRFAASQGAGARDMTELVRVMEGWAGVELRSRAR